MVDFSTLNGRDGDQAPTDPHQVFRRLPKPQHINDLWDSQTAVLREWDERRDENDLVLKLNTGGGKTLVGLLIAKSLMNELEQPALYLCANRQLVAQTAEKASEVGIENVTYRPGSEPLQNEFLNAEAVLIGTYHALFNGRSKFGVRGRDEPVDVGSIICDDAHTAFSILRDIFSLSVDRTANGDLYHDLVTRFRGAFQEVRRGGSFDDIVEHGDVGVLEVPYWAWRDQYTEIRETISRTGGDEYRFVFPLIRDAFQYSHALISRREFTVTPYLPLVSQLPTFSRCEHRIYMSATIPDDSSIVQTFDANPESVSNPIAPESLAGVGERMILAPDLSDINEQEAFAFAQDLCEQVSADAGVVILVPSRDAGEAWNQFGRTLTGDDVRDAVDALNSGNSTGPFIFANRYDGIDLLGQACRLLILDGLPQGNTQYEQFRARVLQGESSISVNLARRVEQGMGRGTRGAGDYCVVLVLGNDLVSWMSRRESLNLMTPSTAAQIEIGQEISGIAAEEEELREVVQQCLTRDENWTRYHAEQLAETVSPLEVDQTAIDAAAVERDHLRAVERHRYEDAINRVRRYIEEENPDRRIEGWLRQLAARTAYFWNDEELAGDFQRHAFGANSLLLPPVEEPEYRRIPTVGSQARTIVDKLEEFQVRTGLLADFQETVSWLTPTATSNQFEAAMKDLGEFLGFAAQRPERAVGTGPDVLWLTEGPESFVIEVKSNKDEDAVLRRQEHGQLLDSVAWFENEYPDRGAIRVVVHPNALASPESAVDDTYALTFDDLGRLVASVREVLRALCRTEGRRADLEERCAAMLNENNLRSHEILDQYLTPFRNG